MSAQPTAGGPGAARRRRLQVRGRLVGVAAVVIALGGAAGAWAVHRGLHHIAHDAFFLAVVAQRVAAGARGPAETAERLHEFVYLNVRTPRRAPAIDDNPRAMLLRGFGYCDQAVYVYIQLLQEREVSGRMTFLRRANGVSPHTVSEVLLDGEWRVFDTLYGYVPRRPDGAVASVRDLATVPALLGVSRAEPEWYRHARVQLVRGPERRKRGGPWLTFFGQALARRLVAVTPRWVVDRLQDVYLRLPGRAIVDPRFAHDPEARGRFLRARSYHVLLRPAAAEREYRALLARLPPDHPDADDVLYNLGLLLLTQGRDPGAAAAVFDRLLAEHPGTPWAGETSYLAGRAYEALGACPRAVALYREVAAGGANGLEDARARLARLGCG